MVLLHLFQSNVFLPLNVLMKAALCEPPACLALARPPYDDHFLKIRQSAVFLVITTEIQPRLSGVEFFTIITFFKTLKLGFYIIYGQQSSKLERKKGTKYLILCVVTAFVFKFYFSTNILNFFMIF